ncbi:MAG: hypothetical protein ACRDT4_07160 [Micromonosporaceae bacterium]
MDAVVAWGDLDTVLARVREHRDAGADHVAMQPLTDLTDHPDLDQRRLPIDQYRRLAAAL